MDQSIFCKCFENLIFYSYLNKPRTQKVISKRFYRPWITIPFEGVECFSF